MVPPMAIHIPAKSHLGRPDWAAIFGEKPNCKSCLTTRANHVIRVFYNRTTPLYEASICM